ncbi:ferredoxin [Gandjariella thermophila]|uniref:Ferredoxin n=1 Tax=Gandjariella thermophila TaxID=1931992 RepID=A0A4D4J558_9PSEU|nr:ferredoxin [Gandjariella thermophila]GDY31661.1 hypothetical protein GTS_32940 [Gandjariella thermophila]
MTTYAAPASAPTRYRPRHAAPEPEPEPEPIDPPAPATAPPPLLPKGRVHVDVNNNHCKLFAICQQEAPDVFELGPDGRLRYRAHPRAEHTERVVQAARCCPMQAITLTHRSA